MAVCGSCVVLVATTMPMANDGIFFIYLKRKIFFIYLVFFF